MSKFKTGDKVTINEQNRKSCSDFVDQILTVTRVDRDGLTHFVTESGLSNAYFDYRFEKVVSRRTEGERIAPEDIRVGDEIRIDLVSDDLSISRQGVVATIGSAHSCSSLWTAQNKRIDMSNRDETLTLVKAGPEPDKVLEFLKKKMVGSVGETPNKKKALIRKEYRESGDCWVTYYPGGQVLLSEKEFAEQVRDYFDDIRWLS